MSEQQKLELQETGPVGSVEEYQFEPIRGYPMFQWKGKRPFRSTQFYPAQLREVHGPEVDGWRNKVYWGDNLQVMSHLLRTHRGTIRLAYIDPPFDSKADYKKVIQRQGQRIWNDGTAFEDKQYRDIWTNDEYLQFMYARIVLIRELLSRDGAVYLHCDSNKVHHLRCVMEEVFGPENFQSQIVWKRSTPKGNMSRGYGAAYDTLLFFTKSEDFHWV